MHFDAGHATHFATHSFGSGKSATSFKVPHVLQLSEDGEAVFDARGHVEGGSVRGRGRWKNRSDGMRLEVLLYAFDIEGIPSASLAFQQPTSATTEVAGWQEGDTAATSVAGGVQEAMEHAQLTVSGDGIGLRVDGGNVRYTAATTTPPCSAAGQRPCRPPLSVFTWLFALCRWSSMRVTRRRRLGC